MKNIVNINNINDLKFSVLSELLSDVYCREVPEIGVSAPIDLKQLETLMVFFSNQYAYTAELWGAMLYEVRTLKRLKSPTDSIDEAMAKRDFLEKVMSACKLKYYACSRLLMYHSTQGGE